MKQTAQAITLNCTKYSDNKLIVNTYTRELGRAAFAIRIPQNRKSSPLPYCQPLFINEIEYNSAPEAEIKQASKIAPSYTYTSIPFSTTKTTTAMFITEILAKVLNFSEKNEELYDYITSSLKLFDQNEVNGKNFHLKFLLQITKYLGFYPANRYSELRPCFDIANAKFTANITSARQAIHPPYSEIFSRILDYDYIPCDFIPLSGSDRSFLLEKIIDYYRYRFENIAAVKSLEVLKTVFH